MSKKSFNIIKSFKNTSYIFIGLGIILIGSIILWISFLQLPDFKLFTERKLQNSTKIYDRTGEILLYDVHKDVKRTIIPYEDIGINVINATVAIEDSEFYKHKGIRIKSILRAVWANITGKKLQGGSTITQQLIKNTLLTSEKSITRKIKEWILAIKLEQIMSKEDIISLYLNEAPYGGNLYGIKEASISFFNKDPMDLTLAESAYLAAIPNGPTYYSPYRKNKDKLDERKNLVLKRMLDLNFITEEVYQNAKKEVVVFLPENLMNIDAPHFVFFIKDYLESKYGYDTLENSGLKIISTIDYDLQKKAEEITKTNSLLNEKNYNGSNASVVVIDSKTGQILTMVGSRDYFDLNIDGNFNVSTAKRQPGSSFKPVVYAAAFEKGYTSNTTLFDVFTEFNSSCDPLGKPLSGSKNATCYHPSNYDDKFRGPLTLKEALAQSINVVAVKLLYLVGINDSIKMARNLGITTLTDPSRYGLSLVIGGGETTLLEMTSAYSVFSNNGIRNPYTGILSVEDVNGKILEKYEDKSEQIISSNITNILSNILSDNEARTPTFGANSILNISGREVAVKTGTTNNNKDAWTIGYTPSTTVGVWVGNNDNKPMKKGGAALAGPIWNAVISEASKNIPVEFFNNPGPIDSSLHPVLRGYWQGGETFKIDSVSGGLTTEFTPESNVVEKSITNVHSILYWINKDNPKESRGSYTNDPQFNNWEYGVKKWWINNYTKFKNTSLADKPLYFDNIHTTSSKPELNILGILDRPYNKNEILKFNIEINSINFITKIDIFINNIFYKTIRNNSSEVSINLNDISNLSENNIINIIGYNTNNESALANAVFKIE